MKSSIRTLAGVVMGGLLAQAQVYLDEPFSYADGSLLDVSAGAWTVHSGTTALSVLGGAAVIDQNDVTGGRADLNRLLTSGGAPIAFDPTTGSAGSLYAGFSLNFSALPNGDGAGALGSYFAHFKSDAANEFYGRVGANVAGAAPGSFRLAIANEAWSLTTPLVQSAQDLQLGVSYNVVVRLDMDAKTTTLWVDPTDESSSSVTAADPISYATGGKIASYALRQGTSGTPADGPGDLTLDNLKVGRTFADVATIPEPHEYALILFGLLGMRYWRRLTNRPS